MLAKILKLYETDGTCNKTMKEKNLFNTGKVETKWFRYHANTEFKIIYRVKVFFRKYVAHFSINLRSYFS